ncbi:major intrinsically disordered NOTCH2-binding receptor 1-like homolog [Acanthochromis polyacanthus]|uniref:major intrinsically disordered NOTCH2-binding receptor 1-like homolog n=1 Tax=Acanthochromis polyacanthus TaxID=80966 RepID=UPI0022342C14|nr:major intrinsically disordered NOTCH2-binding receptor 1-like homolog [Acanthochromis polyacanthus]
MCIESGCWQVKQSVSNRVRMDISVLPNNNHPEKFLQLDVGMLPATYGMFQVGTLMSSQRQWQNRVYSQQRGKTEVRSPPSPEGSPVMFVDRYLEKHITPVTLKSNIKRNPLYTDIKSMDAVNNEKSKPSWTVKEYDTQTIHGNLADYLKEEEKTPKDLEFWTEDLYTPGFDSLLKRKEAEHKRKRLKILSLVILSVCSILILIIVPVVVLQKKD